MKKKWLIAVFLVIVIGVFIGINVWNEKSSGSTDQINTTALEEQEVKETVMASGELKFADEQNVYFQEDKGEVDEFLVEEGDDVEKGDKIVRYKNQEFENELEQTESQLNSQYMELDDIQNQRKKLETNQNGQKSTEEEQSENAAGAAEENPPNENQEQQNEETPPELDDMKLQERQKQAEIEQTKLEKEANEQKIKEATVTSDIDGTVVLIDKDESSGAGQSEPEPMIQVGSLDSMRVEGEISEYDALEIKKEQSVELTSDAVPDESWEGEVDLISDLPKQSEGSEEDSGATYAVESKVKDDDIELKPGFEMLMEIETKNKKANVLPITAVEQEDDNDYVYMVNDGVAERIEIKTGMTTNEVIEMTEGVSEDDIIIEDSDSVEEGMEVDVQ
ncbi:MAG TPA: efflux RND transporter periplasmic adaptor subunit [Pseudogracilibacillus sp.]|nr:efflux RND transporter periplasmic adaptor subunit [Pseudogracilibacillus sp.]